jgi:hypothetical protein
MNTDNIKFVLRYVSNNSYIKLLTSCKLMFHCLINSYDFLICANRYVHNNYRSYDREVLINMFIEINNEDLNIKIIRRMLDIGDSITEELFECILERRLDKYIHYTCIKNYKDTYAIRLIDEKRLNVNDYFKYILEVQDNKLLTHFIERYRNELIKSNTLYEVFECNLEHVKFVISMIKKVDLHKGLVWAVRNSNMSVIDYLINKKKVKPDNEIFETSIETGDLEVVKYFYNNYKFKITDKCFELGINTERFNCGIAKFFIDKGFKINKKLKCKLSNEFIDDDVLCNIVNEDDDYDYKIKDTEGNNIYISIWNKCNEIFEFLFDTCKIRYFKQN